MRGWRMPAGIILSFLAAIFALGLFPGTAVAEAHAMREA